MVRTAAARAYLGPERSDVRRIRPRICPRRTLTGCPHPGGVFLSIQRVGSVAYPLRSNEYLNRTLQRLKHSYTSEDLTRLMNAHMGVLYVSQRRTWACCKTLRSNGYLVSVAFKDCHLNNK
jgi:hypothetical protein